MYLRIPRKNFHSRTRPGIASPTYSPASSVIFRLTPIKGAKVALSSSPAT